jgi:transposase InsO family protein
MASEVIAMEAKLLAVFTAGLDDVNVSELCEQLQISRQTFYKYRRRWHIEGPEGLIERSRRPHTSPQSIGAAVVDEIVRLRKTLEVDNGAQAIAYQLQRSGWPTPAVSTIHRVLVDRGLVTPQPHKRPKTSRRFVWPNPNDAWQIDATSWLLVNGRQVWIMDVLDDHSRLLVAAVACATPSGGAAWDALCAGAAEWGLPAHVMSDNGRCFTTRFLPYGVGHAAFERHLRAAGIRHLLSSPAHPQTCGKLERSHQTTKRWLATQPLAETLAQLQAQLDAWRDHYNFHRPHRAIAGATPAEAWAATRRATPGAPIADVPEASLHTVSSAGHIGYRSNYLIAIGAEHIGSQVLVITRGNDLTIIGHTDRGTGIIRRLTLDTTRRYQPSGRPKGGVRRRPR